MSEVAIGELIELGILCTQESPSTRPAMLDAADDLDRLKRYLSGDTTATFASSLGISSSTLEVSLCKYPICKELSKMINQKKYSLIQADNIQQDGTGVFSSVDMIEISKQ
ncbi:hypothetical protein RJ639_022403 [Escallonia herrerae]|uniref:Uncharacterized protein n=1 Tax=Escallonia herrerae TaxID=1293975 RepID=A0AA88V419_9ASTE|nr:hypothetical protein RJ639_022403 [Escallonia herrerae]